tara:strand:+ start:254217 stop:254921 length:705 start_codon:yes stop_codon:yes gene_type:complete
MASDKSRNSYQKDYQKKRYHSRRQEAIDILGGKCSSCGSTKKLEFDHKDPKKKNFAVTKLWSTPEKEFKGEVKKCRLLCNSCHKKNTAKQRESGEVKSVPGKKSYDDSGRKKKSAAARLLKVAEALDFSAAVASLTPLVKSLAADYGIDEFAQSDFDKSKMLTEPVLVWNCFKRDGGGHQGLVTVYSPDSHSKAAAEIFARLKSRAPKSGCKVDYEDDWSEPGLVGKTLSLLIE